MSEKAKDCEHCAFREYIGNDKLRCTKGHKPRFYSPQHGPYSDYGWKRRCNDFVLGQHVTVFTAPTVTGCGK